jgi:hypothetical protein
MHYLSSIYFVNQPLQVSDMFIAHHQEVLTVYVQHLVRLILKIKLFKITEAYKHYRYTAQNNCCHLNLLKEFR